MDGWNGLLYSLYTKMAIVFQPEIVWRPILGPLLSPQHIIYLKRLEIKIRIASVTGSKYMFNNGSANERE